jgi:hypothetical protein
VRYCDNESRLEWRLYEGVEARNGITLEIGVERAEMMTAPDDGNSINQRPGAKYVFYLAPDFKRPWALKLNVSLAVLLHFLRINFFINQRQAPV